MKRLALLLSLVLVAFNARALAAPESHDSLHAAEQELEAIGEEAVGEHALTGGHDAHDGEHGSNSVIEPPQAGIAPAITALVVFVIVMGILSTTVWPKISKGLAERNDKIRSEIAAAEEARRQAREALNEYESNLAQARAEAQKMLEDTRAQQAALAAELKTKADADLSALRDKARLEIETAKKQALAEIYAESVTLATAMASKILQREVSVADQQRLMDESLAEMKAVNA